MGIIVDVIIAGFIIISGFIGYKKGISNIIINIVGIILALVLATCLKGTLANFINSKTNIGDSLKASISEGITGAVEEKLNIGENSENNEQKSGFYSVLVEKMGITDGIDLVSERVVDFILKAASFIAIFIVVMLITFILKMMLNLVFKLPLLAQVNSVAGLIANTVIALIEVWVVLGILSFLAPIVPGITDFVNGTYLTRALNSINLIVLLLSGGLKF